MGTNGFPMMDSQEVRFLDATQLDIHDSFHLPISRRVNADLTMNAQRSRQFVEPVRVSDAPTDTR